MNRRRTVKPVLVKSSNTLTERLRVRKINKRLRRVRKTKIVDTFIKNAFGTPGRHVYIGNLQ